MGGAALNMGLDAIMGGTDMITVFDDFNSIIKGADTFGGDAIFEDSGWVLTDDASAPTGEEISMNDPSDVDVWAPSCLKIFVGTNDDAGGNMQLDLINGAIGTLVGTADFPHLFIPETAAGVTVLDNTVWVFACRIGLRADLTTTGSGNWEAKCFIGWAAAGDTSILDHDTGVITDANGELFGFHINETGCIDGISKRTAGDSMVESTNWTRLVSTGGVDGTVANGYTTAGDTAWFDLALRMNITDMSAAAANGFTEFFYRRVPMCATAPGLDPGGDRPGRGTAWRRHSTVLSNQTPNGAVAHVPTIEVLNGPTADQDCVVMVDSWAFGCSRLSRMSR
jgi:hypothetical protein